MAQPTKQTRKQKEAEEKYFQEHKAKAKKDFHKSCDLYRRYVGTASTPEERLERLHKFRCG